MSMIYMRQAVYTSIQMMKLFSVKVGGIMERFRNYIGMFIELILMGIMYLIILPFRVLYTLGNRLVSR